jgi:hypothetical protein
VETFRNRRVHLNVGLRLDLPFHRVRQGEGSDRQPLTSGQVQPPLSKWTCPTTLAVALFF